MKILVVGAGPTGLTAACELLRHGLPVRIIDAALEPCQQSRALAIHARTLESFELMGIVEPFLQEGVKLRGACMYHHDKQLLRLSLEELDSAYPFALSLPQSQTEHLLGAQVQSYGAQIDRGLQLTVLKQSETDVSVTINSEDGRETTEQYDWVIGCDGAHSAVRHALHAKFEGSAYQEVFMLADVAVECPSLNMGEMHIWTSEEGILGVIPFSHSRARIIADLDRKQQTDNQRISTEVTTKLPPPTLDEMQEIVKRRARKDMILSDPHWLSGFAIHRRQVSDYRHGRVFLAGDAAHIHSPAGGQGMNTGIQDAFNLVWKLALVLKGAAKESLLDSYGSERHAVGQSVLKLTDFLTRVNTLRNPLAQALRNRLAPALAAQEVVQQRMLKDLAELAINYRKSPVVAEHKVHLVQTKALGHSTTEQPELTEWFAFDLGPNAGDRAPDAHLRDSVNNESIRLYELLRGTQHHLLLLAGARSSAAGTRNLVEIGNFIIDQYGNHIKPHLIAHEPSSISDLAWTASTLLDPELSLHHKYGAGSECLYLIRPDGYVGFRSLPADKLALSAYLEQIFV